MTTPTDPSTPTNAPAGEALAAYGARFGKWPSQERAAEARKALLADPAMRRAYEAEKRLDAALAAYGAEIDRAVAADGAVKRLRDSVLRRIPRRRTLSLPRIAAAVLVASLLGGAVDVLFMPRADEPEIVLADPLIYGPDRIDFR